MNTKPPVPDEKGIHDHLYQTPMLDPYDELRTIPAGWDLSELVSPSCQPANHYTEAKEETGYRYPTTPGAETGSLNLDLFGLDYPRHLAFPHFGGIYSYL